MDLSVTPASLVSSVYENLTENIKKLRERKNAPLTLAEKLLFGHATDIDTVSLNKGETTEPLPQIELQCKMQQHKWLFYNLCKQTFQKQQFQQLSTVII